MAQSRLNNKDLKRDQKRFEIWQSNVKNEEFSVISPNSTDWMFQEEILNKVTPPNNDVTKAMDIGTTIVAGVLAATLMGLGIAMSIASLFIFPVVLVGVAVIGIGSRIGGQYLWERYKEHKKNQQKIEESLENNYSTEQQRKNKIQTIGNEYEEGIKNLESTVKSTVIPKPLAHDTPPDMQKYYMEPKRLSARIQKEEASLKRLKKNLEKQRIYEDQMKSLINNDPFSALALNEIMTRIRENRHISKDAVIRMIENFDEETQKYLFEDCLKPETELGHFFAKKIPNNWFGSFFSGQAKIADTEIIDKIRVKLKFLKNPDLHEPIFWFPRQ